jgi:predicted PurR-regulated permease PerM
MIFLSVITGGLIWGVSGMILFMPFAGIAKVLLEYNESTRPLTALFTILPKKGLKPSVHSKTEEDQG